MLVDAESDGVTKTAYWVVYISDSELQEQKKISMYSFDPLMPNFYLSHPYNAMVCPKTISDILQKNADFRKMAEQYKAEKSVLKTVERYEKAYAEID